MRFVKRVFCLLLCASCILFTGCNSILYNGNLKVEPYEPATLPENISQQVEEKVEQTQEQQDDEKYQIEGTNAFYILPDHENKPDEIVDFKVLDYQEQEGFIYCYKTPYYGSTGEEDAGLTAAKSGIAPEERTATETEDTEILVTVLMSYQPATRAYNVFFTRLEEKDNSGTVSQQVEGIGELTGSVSENRLMAHKLEKEGLYFLFIGNRAYLFDSSGNQTWTYDYNAVIAQEIEELTKRYGRDGYTVETTISDVVMDGSRYVYIPVAIQLEKEGGDGLDLDSLMENDEELENTSFRAVLCCYNLDIGEGNSDGILFTSTNENWERQKEEWLEGNGRVFADEDELNDYVTENSMYNIKRRRSADGGDQFPVFATVGHPINMELAGFPDMFSIDDWELYQWIRDNWNIIEEKLTYSLPDGYYWWNRGAWGVLLINILGMQHFWGSMPETEREQWISLIKAVMALKAQMGQLEIPGLAPGTWNGETNPSPLGTDYEELEALFASKISVYEDGSRTSRFADIQISGRFQDGGDGQKSLKPYLRVLESTEELERTLYYEVEETYEDENGDEHTRTVTYSYTETVPAMPLTYEMVFPDGSNVFWVERQETTAQVAPSGDFGVLYLTDLSEADTADEDSLSQALYDDGLTPVPLSDSQVKGKIVDGGIYYDGDSAVAAVLTSTGMTFYERQGRSFNTADKHYISLSDLSRSRGLAISVSGEEGYTEQQEAPELEEVDENQDAIIEDKLENGADTEIYSASDLTLLNEHEIIISSMYNGIILYNLRNGISIHLEDGCYFASFPESSGAGRGFMVVGYQTDEFTYQPGDIAWAKCYEMDLEAQSNQMEADALKDYVDQLANRYLSSTHQVTLQDSAYVRVEPDEEEKTANERAYRLFFGSESEGRQELQTIINEQGFDIEFAQLWEHTVQVREKLQNQRIGLGQLYRLAGLNVGEDMPENGNLLEIEGRVIRSQYTSNLENLLVELALTDEAVGNLPGEDQERYRGYQESQRLLELSGANMDVVEDTKNSDQDAEKTIRERHDAEEAAQARQDVEEAAYYREVVADLETRFEEDGYGTEGESWDTYLQRMLEIVSPDYATNTIEEGLDEFCQAAGISRELTDQEELKRQLSGVRQVWELEEIIVSMKVTAAAYQNSGYEEEYETYESTHYASDTERLKAFRKAGFYRIITDLQVQNRTFLEEQEMTWEELLEDIIEKCGSGIVLNSGTGQEDTL